jgi:hypothetical protein
VHATLWTPGSERPKGYDRPWIQASGQPIMAPRTQEMAGDPFGLLLRQRIVFLGGEVEDFGADAIISQLLLLDNQDPAKDIKMFINSPGELPCCQQADAARACSCCCAHTRRNSQQVQHLWHDHSPCSSPGASLSGPSCLGLVQSCALLLCVTNTQVYASHHFPEAHSTLFRTTLQLPCHHLGPSDTTCCPLPPQVAP